jgi:hypothetical protein
VTESTKENAYKDDTIFIHNLIEMTRKDDNELKEFINEYLFPQKSKISIESINKNINILKKMDGTQQALVKSRAKTFEESNDPSKYFPTLLAIYGLVISVYVVLQELLVILNVNVVYSIYFRIFLIVTLGITVSKIFFNSLNTRPTAIYFNTLIHSIEFNEK